MSKSLVLRRMDISRGANYLHTKSTRLLTSHFTLFPDNAIVVITSIKLEIVKLKSLLKSKMSEEPTVLSIVRHRLKSGTPSSIPLARSRVL